MRRGAVDYRPTDDDAALGALAAAAKLAAERSGAAIDDALKFIEASNRRIAVLEAKRVRRRGRKGRRGGH